MFHASPDISQKVLADRPAVYIDKQKIKDKHARFTGSLELRICTL